MLARCPEKFRAAVRHFRQIVPQAAPSANTAIQRCDHLPLPNLIARSRSKAARNLEFSEAARQRGKLPEPYVLGRIYSSIRRARHDNRKQQFAGDFSLPLAHVVFTIPLQLPPLAHPNKRVMQRLSASDLVVALRPGFVIDVVRCAEAFGSRTVFSRI
jgi:hypothetical protein